MLLLLCAGSSLAEDLYSPNVNIIAELEKLKNMDEKIQKLEETLSKVLSENEGKVEGEQWLHDFMEKNFKDITTYICSNYLFSLLPI